MFTQFTEQFTVKARNIFIWGEGEGREGEMTNTFPS